MAPRYEFGPAFLIDTEAIGEPGRRTFHLVVSSGHEVASLWLEKEQLQALGLAIRRQLATLRRGRRSPDLNDLPTLGNTPLPPPSLDFRVGQLALGYDPDQDMFTLQADEASLNPAESTFFSCQMTQDQAQVLAQRIEAVVAAGRPLCPLCGAPLNPGEPHICPRSNGHVAERWA